MDFDPQKFFISLTDFFSILLPGALLTYLLMDEVGEVSLGRRLAEFTGIQAWAAFLFTSYLLGHLVFLVGSWMDELLYGIARRYTLNTQIIRLARWGRCSRWPCRVIVWLVFKGERDLAVERVERIKQHYLGALHAEHAINSFQWCKALLSIESQESLVTVQRFEADSKFFRSFSVVLLLLVAAGLLRHLWTPIEFGALIVLFLLALWRYMDQRFKASNQAYWFVITLTARCEKVRFDNPASSSISPTQAGGIVYRCATENVNFCGVSPSVTLMIGG